MSVWGTVTWDIARAGGFTAYILLMLSVALGLALTLHWQSPRWPRLINNELHNFLTILALIFTIVHVLAVWLDPFTHFGWNEILIPLASHYRPLWMALGIVALYLGIAIAISTWIRPLIGYKLWRSLHIFTLLVFALVTVHGIATGSDTSTWWGVALYGSSILIVGTLLWQRLSKPATAQSRAHPVLAMGMLGAIMVGVIWTMLGPLQPGWNVIANNGNGSGGTVAAQAASSSAAQQSGSIQAGAFPASFTGNLQGQLTQQGPDSNGNVTLHLTMLISNGPSGTVQVDMQGQSTDDDNGGINITNSHVTLLNATGAPAYSGTLTRFSGSRRWDLAGTLTSVGGATNQQMQFDMQVYVYNTGQSVGIITATTSSATSGSSA